MKKLDLYILEKLKFNKDISKQLSYPVYLDMYFKSNNIYWVRDLINTESNIVRFGIEDLKKVDPDDGEWHLYRIEVENSEDFLQIFILGLKMLCSISDWSKIPPLKSKEKDIKFWHNIFLNYEDIKDYIFSYSEKELETAYNEKHK